MSYQEKHRPLPPTPTTSNSSKYAKLKDSIPITLDTSFEYLSEREEMLYNELLNCYRIIDKKDLTISNLKTLVIECKKKSSDIEDAYKLLQHQSEEREKFLVKQHEAEMQALISTQAIETNENLEIILRLQKENDRLQTSKTDKSSIPQQLPNSASLNNISNISNTGFLCDTAEATHQLATKTILTNQQNSDELLQEINDMVTVITDTLYDLNTMEDDLYEPALISDASSSDDSYDEIFELPIKKKTPRTSSISNFLFKNKRTDSAYERKRNYSLNDHLNQKKPVMRTYSLLSHK